MDTLNNLKPIKKHPKIIQSNILSKTIFHKFTRRLREKGFTGDIEGNLSSRIVSATDNSIYELLPDLIVFPHSHRDIETLMVTGNEETYRSIAFTPRGGGTGTNGQSLNYGVIIDCSRHMNRIVKFDRESMKVTVEPGVVLNQLNDFLRPHGFFFAPTVSTANRATIGGMIATDASGKGSRIYGKTSDHLIQARTVLASGETYDFEKKSTSSSLDHWAGRLLELKEETIPHVKKHFPKMNRGLTGYNLEKLFQENLELPYLLSGSEGTLGTISEATLKVTPIPNYRHMLVLHYENFKTALRDVMQVLKSDPLAIESMDDRLMTMSRQEGDWEKLEDLLALTSEKTTSCLFVEFAGDSREKVREQVDGLFREIRKSKRCLEVRECPAERISDIWNLRKKAVGMLGGMKGKRKPVAFVEDTAVPPQVLADYIEEFTDILDRHKLDYGMFGHVDVGCLHVRPALNLLENQDRQLIKQISDEVVDLTLKYGGILWGEHGKGVRGEYNQIFFGDHLKVILSRIKGIFDPDNRLNPGKLTSSLEEVELYRVDDTPMKALRDADISEARKKDFPEMVFCNGQGACFNWKREDTMCPSFKVTGDRRHSPKGRSMMIKEYLRQEAIGKVDQELKDDLAESLGLCLSCAACQTDCPVHVDIPAYKSTFLQEYHRYHRRPVSDYFFKYFEDIIPWVAGFPKLVNWLTTLSLPVINGIGIVHPPKLGKPVKKVSGGRGYKPQSVEKLLSREPSSKDLLLIPDMFTYFYNTPVFEATQIVLEKLGYHLLVLNYMPSGKAKHVKGFLKDFSKQASRLSQNMSALLNHGYRLVTLESAIALMYNHEYRDCAGFTGKVELIHEVIHPEKYHRQEVEEKSEVVNLFLHCTEKCKVPGIGIHWKSCLEGLGYKVNLSKTGCCGVAGIFGHEKKHQEYSKKLYQMSWQSKVENSSSDYISTTGFSCYTQVKNQSHIKTWHPLELMARKLK